MMGSNFFFYFIQVLQIIKTTKIASQVKVHSMKPSDLSLIPIPMPHSEGWAPAPTKLSCDLHMHAMTFMHNHTHRHTQKLIKNFNVIKRYLNVLL